MPNSLLLPLLRDDRTVADFVEDAGTWDARGTAELEKISQSLQVTTPAANYSEIDSIPNMWARPLLFEMALYDRKHPLHERIVGEWRGLLAMLALKEWYNFPLTIEQIDIPSSDGSVSAEDDKALLQALGKLLPTDTLGGGTTWSQLYLILFDNHPIGLTSPTTLVCTAADCFGYISDVPWCDGEFLSDPTLEPEPILLPEQRAAVAGWLRHLRDKQINTLPHSSLKDKVASRIKEFSVALGGFPEIPVPCSDHGLGLDHGLFQGMNHPVAAEDYFTEKIFVIRQEEAFHKDGVLSPEGSDNLSLDGDSVTPILPIKKELLADPNVTDLDQRITFEQRATSIVVKLRLPVTGSDGQNGDFVIGKEYRFKNQEDVFENQEDVDIPTTGPVEISDIPTVPVLEIWPNFKRSGWNVYYTYFTSAERDTFNAKPFLLNGEPDSRTVHDDQGNIIKEITKTSRLPEAMLCEYEGTEAGMLLISVPEALPNGEETWTVGVDFGTTSTTVYRNDQHNNPKAMEFDTRLLQVTNSSQRDLLYDDFIPAAPEPTPFLSLFQSFQSSANEEEEQSLLKEAQEPLLNGHIYFLSDYKELTERNIVSNLKWSLEPTDRILAQVFLEQLCLQCVAEAVVGGVREINWRFSFPIAFSEDDRHDFKTIWNKVTNAWATATGLQTGDVISEPESIVAAKFFASNRQSKEATGAFATGAVCIDIGGETSDISIWQDNELYCQTSLRFAGRHIFLNGLTGFLADSDDEQLLTKAKEKGEFKFYAQADALIKENGERWLGQLANNIGRPQVQTFVQFIAVGIAGLLYYVGLVLQYLSENKNFEPKMPSVYIGGNGSKILHWLANGSFSSENPSRERLKQVILDASKFELKPDDHFDLEISINPKHEAAFGLVDDDTILEWDNDVLGLILAGEGFIEGSEKRKWTEILTAERFGKGLRTEKKLEQIENFVKSFNNSNPDEGRIKAIEWSEHNETIYQQLQNDLTKLREAQVEKRRIEPLFILALKYLLE